MTLEELAKNDSFFEGLGHREFVLVLGAGFSFGTGPDNRIKNKVNHSNSLYNNIPLSKEFADITEKELNQKQIVSFKEAVQLWESPLKNGEKEKLFRNLFLADKEHLNNNLYDLYKNILTPDWYRIFTFNFDNVFDIIDKENIYQPIAHPIDKEFTSSTLRHIAYIHGKITDDSDISNLVLFRKNYARVADDENNLYNSLLNSINSGKPKKVLILGCQFNETIHLQKFYDRIYPTAEVYQVDIKKPIISGGTECNYHFIEASTSDFLHFLKEHRERIENIDIVGTKLISNPFRERILEIGEKEEYSPKDFYLAKQDNDCQWYGILKGWDVKRKVYSKLKTNVKQSFNEQRLPKINATVLGRGGSGKSILLRRLAVDLIEEDFIVLWLNDKKITDFEDRGLPQVEEYSHRKILLIIEDWYRIRQNIEYPSRIIDRLSDLKNIRMVIGDRYENGIPSEQLYSPNENRINITPEENSYIIKKIVEENVPSWKVVAESILHDEDSYKSSLYLILWVLARKKQKNGDKEMGREYKPENLKGHFQELIKSDMRFINRYYPGVSKILYYWACVYKDMKLIISQKLFITLAASFNDNNINNYPFASSNVRPILDIYISTENEIDSPTDQSLLTFNHDILVEDGLSDINIQRWQPFDDSIKLKMLDIIIDKGESAITSIFLSYVLKTVHSTNLSNKKKRKYIDDLYENGNKGRYLNNVFKENGIFENTTKRSYASKIIKEYLTGNKYHHRIIMLCFQQLSYQQKQKVATDILSEVNEHNPELVIEALRISNNQQLSQEAATNILSEVLEHNPELVIEALRISNNQQLSQETATNILSEVREYNLKLVIEALRISNDQQLSQEVATNILSEVREYNPELVIEALRISNDQQLSQEVATNILSEVREYNPELVIEALRISNDQQLSQEVATNILSEVREYNPELVIEALKVSNDQQLQQDAVANFLRQDRFWELGQNISVKALKIDMHKEKDRQLQQEAAAKFLYQDRFWKLGQDITVKALKIDMDEEEDQKVQQEAAAEILRQDRFWDLPHQMVSTALKIATEELKVEKATILLNEWKDRNWPIIRQSLKIFSWQNVIPVFVVKIIDSIINQRYQNSTLLYLKDDIKYKNLMKIPFHSVESWEISNTRNIDTWCIRDRDLITNIIYSYRLYPERIKKMCEEILNEWEDEVNEPIPQYYEGIHYGDHIRLSLGHPSLKSEARQTAFEIVKADKREDIEVPEHLLQVAKKIINEGEFPKW